MATATKQMPAREAMKHRTRVTFGKAYLRDVIAGVQTDYDKQLSHAIAIQLDSPSKLKKMSQESLRTKLAERLQEMKEDEMVTSSDFTPFPEH